MRINLLCGEFCERIVVAMCVVCIVLNCTQPLCTLVCLFGEVFAGLELFILRVRFHFYSANLIVSDGLR